MTEEEKLEGDLPLDAEFERELEAGLEGDSVSRLEMVELGEFGEAGDEPSVRYLMGRVDHTPFLLTTYLLEVMGLGASLYYTVQNKEWSIFMVGGAWAILLVWAWIYGISYEYRRRINYVYSLIFFEMFSFAMMWFSFDKAMVDEVFDGHALVKISMPVELVIAGLCAAIGGGVVLSHALYFGRGYRRRRD